MGRIISQREDTFTVVTEDDQVYAHPAGVLFHKKTSLERPGVGDWVLLEAIDCTITDEAESSTLLATHSVVQVLPRHSVFLREAPGGRGEAQVVASNVDTIFIVNPADDINLNRIERFAVAIFSGGATPAVILSKADLVSDSELRAAVEEVRTLVPSLLVLDSHRAQEPDEELVKRLSAELRVGHTYALVGASGVGKSTLVNALMGESIQETGAVREIDHKGRHVTSFRELFPLPNGALLMDTPGVREFAVWSQGEGIEQVFSEIVAWEEECRFSDCSHRSEPNCAVTQAVLDGKLSQRRLDNWRSLCLELEQNKERRQIRQQKRERSQYRRKKKRDKRFSRS